ncbi:MAG: hypothetical protein LBD28_03105 [Tannerellaceae bacterium]|jgi:hypothetical protein|nr:hypothetical protein [Tannerellaceae bacterium]
MYTYRLIALYILTAMSLWACRPEIPITSSIRIDMESSTTPLNDDFYGLSIDEGEVAAIKAELIRNSSFDEGDSMPGWHTLAPFTYMARSTSRPIAPDDLQSLMVSANPSGIDRRGGVSASGYGISLRRTERYELSFYLRTSYTTTPVELEVALEDSAGAKLSLPMKVMPTYTWTRHRHSFIATADAVNARLAFYMRESSLFFIDQVSLIPQTTWNNRGFRLDVMELVDSIGPIFILERKAANRAASGIAQDLNAWHALDSVRTQQKAYYADETWLMADHDFAGMYPTGIRVHGLGCIEPSPSSLRAAVAQACFLIRAESRPHTFRQIAFAPIAGRYEPGNFRTPLIFTESGRSYVSPSYYLLQMFARNIGEVIIPSEVQTYSRPHVERAAIDLDTLDGSFETLAWTIRKSQTQDSTYNYELFASLRPRTEDPRLLIRITKSIALKLEGRQSLLYRHTGTIIDTLGLAALDIRNGQALDLRIACHYDTIQCYLNNHSIHRAVNPSLPSLVAIVTLDNSTRTMMLKVVNTTFHSEKTAIRINGLKPRRAAQVICLQGEPGLQNTSANPKRVAPESFNHNFPLGRGLVYDFPPNSVTILKLRVD